VNILSTENLEIDARAEDLTEEFSAHGKSNFSPLTGFKSKVHLSVYNTYNEEFKNE